LIKEIPGVFLNDPEMSLEDQELIQIMSSAESSEKWKKFVSKVNRHFMLLGNDEWPSLIVKQGCILYNWLSDWNSNRYYEFRSVLEKQGIPSDSLLYVFWMRETGVVTNWGVFCRNWSNFLYEDEGCILVLPNHKTAFVLSNGLSWSGDRVELKA
jgi:hypothetical protein